MLGFHQEMKRNGGQGNIKQESIEQESIEQESIKNGCLTIQPGGSRDMTFPNTFCQGFERSLRLES
jgi:hypothetical protein